MSSNKRIKGLNILRLLACVAVFLYHLDVLKGGYLAVCTFFALTGYLSCKSALSNNEFSIKKYYKSKLKRIYLPLLFAIFISIIVITSNKDIVWLNLKRETISSLLGYNNFWQLKANLNYFTKTISSPFMHLWYIAIILQYYLVFPFIFKGLNKLKNKFNIYVPTIILFILSIISYIFLIKTSKDNLMVSYYHTLSRVFSILLGMELAFIKNSKSTMPKIFNNKVINIIAISLYSILLLVLFILMPSDNKYIYLNMLSTTIITILLIEHLSLLNNDKETKIDKVINYLSNLTYEFYLIQYPVIYLFQYLDVSNKILLITLITLASSIIINYALNGKKKILKYIALTIISLVTLYGVYIFITAKDYSKEMKALEEELAQNEKLIEQSQETFIKNQEDSQTKWNELLTSYTQEEEKIKEAISSLPVVAVGDSVMLGAIPNLKQTFTNGYYDAKISRTAWVVNDILVDLKTKNMLEGPVILHLGTNGDCAECRKEIMETLEGKEVFWLTITNDRSIHFNEPLYKFAENYDNLHIIDWNSISSGHNEYFVADKIHLTETGRVAYTNAIYEAISNFYLSKITEEKEKLIEEHETEELTKVTFVGNDLLINNFQYINSDFSTSNFVLDNNFDYDSIYTKLKEMKENNTLTKKVVLGFDSTLKLTQEEYNNLVALCDTSKVYTITLSNEYSLENQIKFYEQLKDSYIMADKIHLTKEGNEELSKMIKESLATVN